MEFLPFHVTSGAKVILSFTHPEIVDSMINGELEKFTENTITDIEAFKCQLQEIKVQGIAYDHGEASEDVHAVSAPLFNQEGKAIASISICVPSNRVNKILNAKNIAELRETTQRLSGYL